MKHTTTLEPNNPNQCREAMSRLWVEVLKPALANGRRIVVTAKTETRSLAENAFLHALLSHIAARQEWAGKKRDAETWKRLLIAAWCRARGESVELLPAIDGHGVDIVFRRSSELTVSECAELIEFVYAWGAMNDVRFPADPRQIEAAPRLAAPKAKAKQREEVPA